jgi:hypothetical protein
MFSRSLPLLALLLFLGSCAAPCNMERNRFPYSCATNFPYGTWSAPSGYSIELRRDDTYRVCKSAECDEGRVEFFGRFGIRLTEFGVPGNVVANAVLDESGYRENVVLLGGSQSELQNLDFSPNVGPGAIERLCAGRPCVNIGGDNRSYLFVLERHR